MRKLFICAFIVCVACKDQNTFTKEENLLIQTIFSETFAEKFRVCDKVANEIAIYNGTDHFTEFTFSEDNYCDKTLVFNEIDFILDANSLHSHHKAIVLYSFKEKSSQIIFGFLQLETKRIVKYIYDKNGTLLKIIKGHFKS